MTEKCAGKKVFGVQFNRGQIEARGTSAGRQGPTTAPSRKGTKETEGPRDNATLRRRDY
jgi:hypothetical protein